MSLISYKNGQGSIILRVKILDSSLTTGGGLTGLTSASSGLIISTIADNEASATVYTVAASHVQTIAALGTYAAPSASNCRFAEVDSTNHKGVYEIQIADARYGVSNAKSVLVSISGPTHCCETDVVIPLTTVDPYVGGGKTPATLGSGDYTGNTPQTGDPYARLNTLIGHAFTYSGSNLPFVDASGGGLLHVDVGSINSVSTSNVTTINQVLGQLHEIATTAGGAVTFSNTEIGLSSVALAAIGNRIDFFTLIGNLAQMVLSCLTATPQSGHTDFNSGNPLNFSADQLDSGNFTPIWTSVGSTYFLWFDNLNDCWIISTEYQVSGSSYWKYINTGVEVIGVFEPQGSVTGTITVTFATGKTDLIASPTGGPFATLANQTSQGTAALATSAQASTILTNVAAIPVAVWNVLQSAIAAGATMGRWLLGLPTSVSVYISPTQAMQPSQGQYSAMKNAVGSAFTLALPILDSTGAPMNGLDGRTFKFVIWQQSPEVAEITLSGTFAQNQANGIITATSFTAPQAWNWSIWDTSNTGGNGDVWLGTSVFNILDAGPAP